MWLDISENCGLHKKLFLKGYHEPEWVEVLRSELKEGMTVVDIGANIGYHVLIEAQIVGNKGKIYALEPEPRNVELLRRNIALNQYDNIAEVSQVAVSDKDRIDKLYISKASDLHHLARGFTPKDNCIEVKTVTLDSFVKDKRPPDFIRMDVEGFEYYIEHWS